MHCRKQLYFNSFHIRSGRSLIGKTSAHFLEIGLEESDSVRELDGLAFKQKYAEIDVIDTRKQFVYFHLDLPALLLSLGLHDFPHCPSLAAVPDILGYVHGDFVLIFAQPGYFGSLGALLPGG